ncbi:uncharacterized protein LOC116669433 [Etheostoma spectabile]|uniref:uncharacterized protein LOC116669433 n=1 Tax=Etheostoma spectabile TaxID=54343 RepID=UPI0013AF0578|nr:uncharacterized protein LOC116669433 [Etheostoma spectabile]
MNNFTLITALLLCSCSWISVSASESLTVEVQSGGNVTLMCSNMSKFSGDVTFWFRLGTASDVGCVSVMFNADTVKYCEGFQNGNFNMSTNSSTLFLQIKQVNVSDSGLYFCGFYTSGILLLSVTHLNVEAESDGTAKLMSGILGVLTVLLLMIIIGLVVKIRKLQTAANEEQNPQQPENRASEEVNYAAVAFRPKTRKKREVEPNVVYASTR